MKIPDNIQREHVLRAMEQIDREGFVGKDSRKYDLIYEGEIYPPKLVLSIANKFANDKELELKNFRPNQAISFLNLYFQSTANVARNCRIQTISCPCPSDYCSFAVHFDSSLLILFDINTIIHHSI
jgi:hypothetical protein